MLFENSFNKKLSSIGTKYIKNFLEKMETFRFMFSSNENRLQLRRQKSVDEDGLFRESIFDCMVKAIELFNAKDATIKPLVSMKHFPRMIFYDSHRQKTTFTNLFDFINPDESSADGDFEFVNFVISVNKKIYNTQNFMQEWRNDFEIVYFSKNTILVEQGE